MKSFLSALAGVSLLAVAAPANAGLLFAIDNGNDTLVTIDTVSFATTTIGSLGTDVRFGGLAYDPNSDTMFMIGGRSNNNLFTVDRTTGAASLVGSHGINDLFGLAFDSVNNSLFASQFSGGSGLFTLDTFNGAATTVNGNMTNQIGGLAYDSRNDRLVGINDGGGSIHEIDRGSGAQALLFNGLSVNDSGLAYDPDLDLFWDVDFSGRLFSYDPNNGFSRTTHLTGLGTFDGLAYLAEAGPTPVPEPSTLAALGIGLLTIGAIARRRRKV